MGPLLKFASLSVFAFAAAGHAQQQTPPLGTSVPVAPPAASWVGVVETDLGMLCVDRNSVRRVGGYIVYHSATCANGRRTDEAVRDEIGIDCAQDMSDGVTIRFLVDGELVRIPGLDRLPADAAGVEVARAVCSGRIRGERWTG